MLNRTEAESEGQRTSSSNPLAHTDKTKDEFSRTVPIDAPSLRRWLRAIERNSKRPLFIPIFVVQGLAAVLRASAAIITSAVCWHLARNIFASKDESKDATEERRKLKKFDDQRHLRAPKGSGRHKNYSQQLSKAHDNLTANNGR